MTVWATCMTVGAMLGLELGDRVPTTFGLHWSWIFFIMGTYITGSGILVYYFMVIKPSDIGLPCQDLEGILDSKELVRCSSLMYAS